MKNQIKKNINIPWQVQKFEEHEKNGQSVYFDVDDFVEVIIYYIEQEKCAQALRVTNYALSVHKEATELLLKKAQLMVSLNHEQRALILLDQVEKIEPSNSELPLIRGDIYSKLSIFDKAIEEYSRALPDTDEPDTIYLQIANEYMATDQYDKALEYFRKALEVNPENHAAINEANHCLDSHFDGKVGVEFYQKIVDLHPFSADAWFNLAVSYASAEFLEKALEAFDFALILDEKFYSAWLNKGLVLILLERFNEALEALKKILNYNIGDELVSYHMGECYEKMGDHFRATDYYHQTIRFNPNFPAAWEGLGFCELEMGNARKAVLYLEQAIELDPSNSGYLLLLADAYITAGEYDKAIEAYEKAIVTDPENPDVWLEYADSLWQIEKHEMAIQVTRNAFDSLPQSTNLQYRLAAFLFLRGKEQEAAYHLEEALSKDRDGNNQLLEDYPELTSIPAYLELINIYNI